MPVGAVHDPGARRSQAASARAPAARVSSGLGTPTICRVAPAGFVSGPSRLNAVRIPSLSPDGRRVPHRRMERRREEECDVRVAQRLLHDRVAAPRRSRQAASKRSALPHRLDTDRLPCFATFTPHAATTTAAADETLNVPERSPPVPHVSNTSPGGVASGTACSRIVRAKPTISSGRSPFITSAARRPASAPGAARPSMTSRMAWRGLVGREVLVANELLDELREHHRSRKFRRIFRPSPVSTDSG